MGQTVSNTLWPAPPAGGATAYQEAPQIMTSPMRINFSVARLRLAWLFVGRTITAQRQAPDGSPAREELETGFLGAPELQRWNKEREEGTVPTSRSLSLIHQVFPGHPL